MVVWGNDLTAGGVSNPPYISVNGVGSNGGAISVSGFHLGGGWSVTEYDSSGGSQINIPYWVDANATAGSYSLVLTTAGGSSSPRTFTVGDATPVITAIAPSSFQAGGVYTNVTISGSNLGTVCPSVTIVGGGNTTFSPSSCSNTSVSGTLSVDPNADPNAPGTTSATVTAKSNGYGQGWIPQSGSSQQSGPISIALTPPPPPTVALTLSGSAVSANSTVYITPAPALPLSAVLVPGRQGVSLTGNPSWTLTINYVGPGQYDYGCTLTSTRAANTSWDISSAFGGQFCGGQAQLAVTYQGYTQTVSFTILGQNPSVATVKTMLGTSPWFIQQLANSDSPGYQQFSSNGQPVFGAPNGFGIMMLDYKNTVSQLWTWTQNVNDGVAYNTSNSKPAADYWKSQVSSWNTWNATPAYVPMKANTTEGPCIFSYNPAAGQHPFSDAIWIRMYNSNSLYWYRSFINGAWVINNSNGSGFDYVNRVCTTVP